LPVHYQQDGGTAVGFTFRAVAAAASYHLALNTLVIIFGGVCLVNT
jgi:hypothetical protein